MPQDVQLLPFIDRAPTNRAGAIWRCLARFKVALPFAAAVTVPLCGLASPSDPHWGALFTPAQKTTLIELRQGSDLSNIVRATRRQGFETADGEPVAFSNWYSTRWTDVRLSWLTHVSPHTGVIWGLNTGERGEKYRISPGIKLGFIHQAWLGRNTVLTLRATTTLGSRLREKTCTADYGEIGGIQAVNCRLAATQLAPEETLQHLYNAVSRDQRQFSITFNHAF